MSATGRALQGSDAHPRTAFASRVEQVASTLLASRAGAWKARVHRTEDRRGERGILARPEPDRECQQQGQRKRPDPYAGPIV